MANDEEMDRLEQELRDYLRTPRDSWKREPKMRMLLERQKQYEEELRRRTPNEPPKTKPE